MLQKLLRFLKVQKKDLISVFDIAEEKVDVIYHGNSLDENSATEAISSFHLPGKYILFVGNRIFYKNFLFFYPGCFYDFRRVSGFEYSLYRACL